MNEDILKNLFDRLGIGASTPAAPPPLHFPEGPAAPLLDPRPAPRPPAEEIAIHESVTPPPIPAADIPVLLRGELALEPRAYAFRAGKSATLGEVLYRMVSFSVSALAHLCIAIFLALVIVGVAAPENPIVSIILGESHGKAIEPKPPGPEAGAEKEEPKPEPPKPEEPTPMPPVPADPSPTPPVPPAVEPPPPTPGASPPVNPDVVEKAHIVSGRTGATRAELLGKYGGNEASESAVENGLKWLATHQAESGEWNGREFDTKCPKNDSCHSANAPGDRAYSHGLTGLCVLAYLGAGYTPGDGPYGDTLQRALDFLVSAQRPSGGIDGDYDINLYNHSICTWALCETFAITKEEKHGKAARKALDYLLKCQYAGGGWDYYFIDDKEHERNDTSIGGWAIMALRSAQIAGMDVPSSAIENARALITKRTDNATGELVYAERKPGVGRKGAGLVAVGLLCRLYLQMPDPEPIRAGALRMLKNLPSWEKMEQVFKQVKDGSFYTEQNMYTWYYGTIAMFQLGGDYWQQWNKALRDQLCTKQIRKGHKKGSWEPEPNYIGREGGRVFSTVINVLNLEVYYRYLPLYGVQDGAAQSVPPPPPAQGPAGPKTDYLELLRKGNQGDRIRAMTELAKLGPDAEAAKEILARLADADLQVRWAAVKALAEMNYREGLPKLVEGVRGEPSALKGSMLEYLAKFKDPSTLPLFLESLDDAVERVAEGAAAALRTYSGRDFGRDKAAWAKWAATQK